MSQPIEERRGDAIGEVGDDARRRLQAKGAKVDLPRIADDNLEPIRIGRSDVGERRQAARVLLDGDDARCALHQQRSGEAAGSWANLDNGRAFERSGGAGDAAGEIEIEQEILAEAFPRGKP